MTEKGDPCLDQGLKTTVYKNLHDWVYRIMDSSSKITREST